MVKTEKKKFVVLVPGDSRLHSEGFVAFGSELLGTKSGWKGAEFVDSIPGLPNRGGLWKPF